MKPDWNTLPADIGGDPRRRMVNGQSMDREEYDVVGWLVVKEYVTDKGEPGFYWAAPLAGLQEYGQLKEARRVERRERWQQAEEWSREVERMIEREP